MKRSFFISLLVHGAVLFLFFSWGIPLGERSLARNVIQVLLVAEEDGGKGGGFEKEKKNGLKNEIKTRQTAPGNDSREKEMPPNEPQPIVENPPRKAAEVAPSLFAREEEENPKQKAEWNKKQVSETEAPNVDWERKNEPRAGVVLPPKTMPAEAQFGSAPTVLASGTPLMGRESISLGGGIPFSTDGTSLGMSGTGRSSSEGDSLLARIVGKIEAAKKYPRTARRMGIQGTATVRFKLKPNGQLEKVELVESSGSKILDEASLETVREAAPLPYKEGWLKVGIVFKIL